ncbi:TIR domain-containing protein [Nonomuraea sp. 3-1Str]|uniref:toll/interleukin-1 receptor domain-containing protein n=1 Tax=Nonomuraea sp. 3-1Str TaxID=2929801 RepID=UPI00285753D1|nr:TIR domain-containing protein [Nonomuraea sp. 3-1Str]MDR8407987.1 TIR domain-containing protein [Nonomuraea sp. 3-1Str]
MASHTSRYDVALSFAGEERDYVEQVAATLKAVGVRVFYDEYEKASLWGKDLYEHLDSIYRNASRYCILFVSENYARKVWTNHERKSAQARALQENEEYVLPVRFDDTELPGLRPTVSYVDARTHGAQELGALVLQKLDHWRPKESYPVSPDRLWRRMKARSKREKRRTKAVSRDFYEALRRMSPRERRAVSAVLAFGCRYELPLHVHISLDYLRRMTGIPQSELMADLATVRSLDIRVQARPITDSHLPGDLIPDDQDIRLTYWSREAIRDDATTIAYWTINEVADHFCADHGLEMIEALDFSRLSSACSDSGAPSQTTST